MLNMNVGNLVYAGFYPLFGVVIIFFFFKKNSHVNPAVPG